jgi:hypothetical protein
MISYFIGFIVHYIIHYYMVAYINSIIYINKPLALLLSLPILVNNQRARTYHYMMMMMMLMMMIVEDVIAGGLPTFLPPIMSGCHVTVLWFYIAIRMWETVDAHRYLSFTFVYRQLFGNKI